MNIESKAEQLITKLLRETYEGFVRWEIDRAPTGLTVATEDVYPLFLSTNYKGTNIGLYQRRSKYFVDEHEYYWSEDIGLCVFQNNLVGSAVIWQYDGRSISLGNLFSAAREQASGIDTILDDLLK